MSASSLFNRPAEPLREKARAPSAAPEKAEPAAGRSTGAASGPKEGRPLFEAPESASPVLQKSRMYSTYPPFSGKNDSLRQEWADPVFMPDPANAANHTAPGPGMTGAPGGAAPGVTGPAGNNLFTPRRRFGGAPEEYAESTPPGILPIPGLPGGIGGAIPAPGGFLRNIGGIPPGQGSPGAMRGVHPGAQAVGGMRSAAPAMGRGMGSTAPGTVNSAGNAAPRPGAAGIAGKAAPPPGMGGIAGKAAPPPGMGGGAQIIPTPGRRFDRTEEEEGGAQPGTCGWYLARRTGYFAVCDFLIGGHLMAKQGILHKVGADYIVLYDDVSDQYMVCDFASLKFITLFNATATPKHLRNRR